MADINYVVGLALTFAMAPSVVRAAEPSSITILQADPKSVAALTFAPSPVFVKVGESAQVNVVATHANGERRIATNAVVWWSDNPRVATVDPRGTVVGATVGTTLVGASLGDAVATLKVVVEP